ncbi:hypothetical protein GQ43DRAFT_381580 [Delitschia confertaspora ATCC 74209]|uniref:Uncharacterized protein n=1 Tax=Delitschia confertaspora ATCC 74209 TaxID=1513339 RepID=A0A9P4MNK0_9PLEO|nr:hypothetical protein GQ43DRAFT_381580 [Delitschia confertaspora ATCC 74209]
MKEAIDAQRRMSEAGFAAEYERLEDKLGSGMSSIVEIPFLYRPGAETRDIEQLEQLRGNPRGLSTVDGPSRLEAQVQAEKSGEILAISEVPTDLSHLSGSTTDFETVDTRASMFTTENADSGESKTTSYYFPEDPDMPSWKPFSMRWHYISLLTVLALGLAGLQEFLCQSSIKKTKKGGGLLRFQKPGDLSVTKYFTWKYAPTLTFVIYGILWQISDFEVKRLEPFYQLSQKSGATAAESLNMDYLTFMSWLVPLRALRHKQYAVIYSSLATLVASSLVPVLQSASVTMYSPKEKGEVDDYKYIRIDPRWSRAVTSSLVFVAICGVVLLFQLRRKSGLMSDPKGIAGVAAMATRSHILGDFHGLDAAPLNKIHKQLRHRRYILHKSSLWQGEYIRKNNERIPEYGTDPRPLMLRLRAGIPYIAFMILFAIAVPIFIFVDYAHSVTQKVPFLLTAIATIVKLLWGTMNHDVRMLEPFFILSNRDAPPQTLTLDYTGTNPIWLPFKAILNKHYIVAGVGVGSVLTEILTVCVSSFSVDGQEFLPGTKGTNDKEELHDRYNTDETFRSFWVSFSLVIGILFLLVAIASIVYLRRSHKFIPRQIGTIASVLAFIHQSKMLVAFVDTEKMDSSAMTRHLEQQHPPKKYALGWFSGRDGEDHLGIDEEPILDRYVYGEDWTKTRVLPSQIGTWEHY